MRAIIFKLDLKKELKKIIKNHKKRHDEIFAGLDIGHQSIKLVLIKQKKGNWGIESRIAKLSPGVINSNGAVENITELIGAIEGLIDDTEISQLAVSIPTKGALVKSQDEDSLTGAMWGCIRLPIIDKEEVAVSAVLKVEEISGINMADAIYDTISLSETISRGVQQDQVFIAISPPGISSEYLQILKETGLKPTVFEISPVALWRSLGAVANNVIGVDIGHEQTIVFQMRNGKPVLPRTSKVTGKLLNEAIKSELGLKDEEIELVKRSRGTSIYTGSQSDVGTVIRKVFQPLLVELRAALTHFSSDDSPVLIVSGESSYIFGLSEFLKAELGEDVIMWDAKKVFNSIDESEDKTLPGPEYAIALGLAMRFFNQKLPSINLLPPDYQEKVKFAPVRRKTTGFISATIACVVVLSIASALAINSMQKKVAYAETLQSQIKSMDSEGKRIETETKKLSKFCDRLDGQYQNIDWSDFLDYIRDYNADSLWINYIVEGYGVAIGNEKVSFGDNLEGSAETIKTLPAYDGRELIIMRMAARSMQDVSVFLQHLRNYPLIEYVDISGIEEIFLNTTPVMVFEVYCVPINSNHTK